MNKTQEVGSVFFTQKHGKLQVVIHLGCEGCACYIQDEDKCDHDPQVGLCGGLFRKDGNYVIFKPYKKMAKTQKNDDVTIFGEVIYPKTKNPLQEVVYDKENPIGEPFFTQKYGTLVAVEAKEGESCEQCAIYDTKKKKCGAATINIGSCSPNYREDGKEVIFKNLKELKKDKE